MAILQESNYVKIKRKMMVKLLTSIRVMFVTSDEKLKVKDSKTVTLQRVNQAL